MEITSLRRVFTGRISTKMTHFERNHLRAYILGRNTFSFGFNLERKPMKFNVLQSFMTSEDYYKYIENLDGTPTVA